MVSNGQTFRYLEIFGYILYRTPLKPNPRPFFLHEQQQQQQHTNSNQDPFFYSSNNSSELKVSCSSDFCAVRVL